MLRDLLRDLREDEGFVPHAYQDHLGYWTIGIGTLIDQRKGGGITEEEAEYLAENRLRARVWELDRAIPWWRDIGEGRRRALVNMAFQLGTAGLLGFKRMLAAMEAGDFEEAARQALDSLWAQQTPKRAARVAKLIKEG